MHDDPAGLRLIEAADEAEQAALAGTVVTDQADACFRQAQVQLGEHGLFAAFERNCLQVDVVRSGGAGRQSCLGHVMGGWSGPWGRHYMSAYRWLC
jgi:hypothetical protein